MSNKREKEKSRPMHIRVTLKKIKDILMASREQIKKKSELHQFSNSTESKKIME